MKRRTLLAPLVAATMLFAACGSDDDSSSEVSTEVATAGITIDDPWVREPAAGQTTAAGYGTITNGTDVVITLIGASAPITATLEIHEVTMNDEGQMSMNEKAGGYEIAPGESLTLEPGGAHVMMLGIDPDEFDDSLALTFVFDSDQVATDAEIREIGDSMGDMDMDMDMDMDEMDDEDMDEMEM